jgi:DNA-binding NarL/FixJ family response regulator
MNAPHTMDISVMVDHPDPLLCMGLVAAVGQQGGIRVQPQTGEGAMDVDVVIASYEQGVRLATLNRNARRQRPRVMVVAQHGREQEVRQALEAGVHGYLMNGCRVEDLVDGIQALAHGQRYMCALAAQRVADSMAREALTSRETEVLALLVNGHCNKTIARQLDIAVGTVKAHMKGIMSKLDVSSRTQAVSVAVSRGLVDAVPM